MRALRSVLVAALITLALSSCYSSGTSTRTPNLQSAEGVITGFDPSPSHLTFSFYTINQMAVTQPASVRQAALKHLGDSNPKVHYAAVYALALTATPEQGGAQLVAMLASPSLDERLLSAASLAGTGDKRGIPVLIDALDESQPVSYWDPPMEGYEFAQTWLLNLTDQDFGLQPARACLPWLRHRSVDTVNTPIGFWPPLMAAPPGGSRSATPKCWR